MKTINQLNELPPWLIAPAFCVASLWLLLPVLLPWFKAWLAHRAKLHTKTPPQADTSASEVQKYQPSPDRLASFGLLLDTFMAFACLWLLLEMRHSELPATVGSVAMCAGLAAGAIIGGLRKW